jgi:hypothetical protein
MNHLLRFQPYILLQPEDSSDEDMAHMVRIWSVQDILYQDNALLDMVGILPLVSDI